ncbi:MAG: peptidoglycan-binding protein [Alphaproteobacteria bacterium]|nr:peptidoglycan-binding protein [Alphaproteobacteria bacterium]
MTPSSRLTLAVIASLLLLSGCAAKPKPAPEPVMAAAPEPPPPPPPPPPAPDPGLVTDKAGVIAAQRALLQLGYKPGKLDGVAGAGTERAVKAFQKDHGLAEEGRLTLSLAARLKSALAAANARAAIIALRQGDMLIYNDGEVEFAAAGREVQWEQSDPRELVAIRPDMGDWPAAAKAGLDWALTHALDEPVAKHPLKWSSTGVARHFEIRTFAALTPREAGLVGGSPQYCRRYELRTDDPQLRYPGIACQDTNGSWYIPHSTIRFARPASGLQSRPSIRKP